MPIKILMPALSPTMTEGNLAKWLKNEGDTIKSGDVIAEIETDKATMEVEAVDEGTLGKILVPGGTEGVKVNEPIALLLEEGEDKSALDGASAARRRPRPTARPSRLRAAQPKAARTGAPLPHRQPAAGHPASGERISASPLARRMAAQAGLDLDAHHRLRPARPDRQGRHRGGAAGTEARPRAAEAKPAPRPRLRRPRPHRQPSRRGRAAERRLRRDPALQHAQGDRAAPDRGQADHPAFLPDARLRARRAAGHARPAQRPRRGRLQALGQRLRHQGGGAGDAQGARASTPPGAATRSTSTRTSTSRWRSPSTAG